MADRYKLVLDITSFDKGGVEVRLEDIFTVECDEVLQVVYKNLHPFNPLRGNVFDKVLDKTGSFPCQITICPSSTVLDPPDTGTGAGPTDPDYPDPCDDPLVDCNEDSEPPLDCDTCCMLPIMDPDTDPLTHQFFGTPTGADGEALLLSTDFDDLLTAMIESSDGAWCSEEDEKLIIYAELDSGGRGVSIYFQPNTGGTYNILISYVTSLGATGYAWYSYNELVDPCSELDVVEWTLSVTNGTKWNWNETLRFTRSCS